MHNRAPEDPFEDIRPYRDEEVPDVVRRLLHEPELLSAVVRFRYPRLARFAGALLRRLVRRGLERRFGGVGSVAQLQDELEWWFDHMIAETTSGFSWSGLDRLRPERAYLFVSNHRDIALDSGFTNYALHAEGHHTARIAIGDNLLQRAWTTDLMRLNKSFVVRRSVKGVREMFRAYETTSRYIHHSIAEGASVWIAQREGRAKDGWDRTEPALVKMLHMGPRRNGVALEQAIRQLHVVPIAISYELDPCDAMKARELRYVDEAGVYRKPEGEDIRSIVTGIVGFKGRVHVQFGEEIVLPAADADTVAAAIDRQIVAGFRLFPTHIEAYERLRGGEVPEELRRAAGRMNDSVAARFRARLDELPPAERGYLLAQYANPVRQRLAQRGGPVARSREADGGGAPCDGAARDQ